MSLLRPGVIKQHKLNQTKQYISELLIIHKGKINPMFVYKEMFRVDIDCAGLYFVLKCVLLLC